MNTEQHEAGLSAARAVAHWHIGDGSWADLIVRAYLNPAAALVELEEEKRDPR